MTRSGALPRIVQAALASPGGRCYRHCKGPIRTVRVRSTLPGTLLVRACPAGVVSVTVYAEWAQRDPTRALLRVLRRWTVPGSLARVRDLRLATRHGPELGHTAERVLARSRQNRTVRVVYWRVYPFRTPSGSDRRLFVCVRHSHPSPVFFAASPAATTWGCPVCGGRRTPTVRRTG